MPIPVPSSSAAASSWAPGAGNDDRQKLLIELWDRGILDRSSRDPEGEDLQLLERLREAERLGAFDLLRERQGTLRGFAVKRRGGARGMLWLNRTGYERYVFFKSQAARKYFEDKGTDAKWVFRVRTKEGKKVFDVSGKLTAEGDRLFTRIVLGLAAEWLGADGQPRTNVRKRHAR